HHLNPAVGKECTQTQSSFLGFLRLLVCDEDIDGAYVCHYRPPNLLGESHLAFLAMQLEVRPISFAPALLAGDWGGIPHDSICQTMTKVDFFRHWYDLISRWG